MALLLAAWGCSSAPATLGRQELADSTFLNVLLEMHMVEGAMASAGTFEVTTRRDSLSAKLYNEILSRHNVSPADFNETLLYYQNHPTEFEVMYDSLIAPLADSAAKVRARAPEVKSATPPAAKASSPSPTPSSTGSGPAKKQEDGPEGVEQQRKEIQRRLREQRELMKRNKNASGGTGAN